MREEVKRILKMVEEKKITADEAEKLLEAIQADDAGASSGVPMVQGTAAPKFLRIHVIDGEDEKVNINIPFALVEVGLRIGMQVAPQFVPEMEGLKGIDYMELINAVKDGARGKIVEVKDKDSHVEIYVE